MAAGGLHVGASAAYQNAEKVHVGVGGSWEEAKRVWIGVGGSWEEGYLHLPGQPQSLSLLVNPEDSSSALDLTWQQHGTYDTATSWKIERAPDVSGSPGTWATIESSWSGTMPYTDSGLDPDTTYWYRVSGINYQGTSTVSSAASGTTDPSTP